MRFQLPLRLSLGLILLLADSAFSARVTNPNRVPSKAVLLSKVAAITVHAGKQTASRRVSPVPQLQCVGPAEICKLYSVDVMRCTNEGAGYNEDDIQWSCKASLPEEFKLGSTDVGCEGYESSEDPYVLSGSCGVEYRLLLTEKGEEKYRSQFKSSFRRPSDGGSTEENAGETWAGYLFGVLFLLVLFIILRGIYNAWQSDTPRQNTRRPRGGGNGGGSPWGGDDDNNDPPPPYDSQPPRPKKSTTSSPRSSTRTQQEGWRPGFWTGTAAGAAAGYAASRAGAARTQPQAPQTGGGWFGGGQAAARPDTGGGWFGGGNAAPGPSRQSRPSPPSFSFSSSSSHSDTRHESTGFGSTSRR